MSFDAFRQKMQSAGLGDLAIKAFELNYNRMASGESTLIPEASIKPATGLTSFADLPTVDPDPSLLASTVFIKLNGGLGTGMGLEKAKSLLEVKSGLTFLDLIAKQILHLRSQGAAPQVLLMNSFSTSADTLAALGKYPELGNPSDLEFVQNKVPKINATTNLPVEHPENPDHEWCPPGHGDLYVALAGSGKLDALLAAGVRYAFVSNSDNLGATLDPKLLAHFAASNAPFLMEVTRRTTADRKGGHLCANAQTGQLILRESAQCPASDEAAFQDIDTHQFFNTNNLWVNLPALKQALGDTGGVLPLATISNSKTVDPRDSSSTGVIQLETAMGAAIGCFEGAGAVVVPRTRFAPVKTTADLLALRSDAYVTTPDFRIELDPARNGNPPTITLDNTHYKLVDGLESLLAGSVPSLLNAKSLTVSGPWTFSPGYTSISGDVQFENPTSNPASAGSRDYSDELVSAS